MYIIFGSLLYYIGTLFFLPKIKNVPIYHHLSAIAVFFVAQFLLPFENWFYILAFSVINIIMYKYVFNLENGEIALLNLTLISTSIISSLASSIIYKIVTGNYIDPRLVFNNDRLIFTAILSVMCVIIALFFQKLFRIFSSNMKYFLKKIYLIVGINISFLLSLIIFFRFTLDGVMDLYQEASIYFNLINFLITTTLSLVMILLSNQLLISSRVLGE